MAHKLLSVTVKGNRSSWGFLFYGDPKNIPVWADDGIEVVELSNLVPAWAFRYNLISQYVFLQDIWNFKNPFNKDKGGAMIVNVDEDR